MTWIEKGQPTPFDNQPIEGLWFLDGDQVAREFGNDWVKGQKLPLIHFPSEEVCDISLAADPKSIAIVHLFGEMDLPYGTDREGAFEQANSIAEEVGYLAQRVGENAIEIRSPYDGEHFKIVFDNEARHMVDVIPVHEEQPKPKVALFSLGRVVATPGALECLEANKQDPLELVARHVTGDWGDLDEEDVEENNRSVKEGYRILSAYKLAGCKVWIITEHDRSVTTLLLPEEY